MHDRLPDGAIPFQIVISEGATPSADTVNHRYVFDMIESASAVALITQLGGYQIYITDWDMMNANGDDCYVDLRSKPASGDSTVIDTGFCRGAGGGFVKAGRRVAPHTKVDEGLEIISSDADANLIGTITGYIK